MSILIRSLSSVIRKAIIDYITQNPGCTKQDIDRHKEKVDASRKTIYSIVAELVREGLIEVVKERPNSRDQKLYVKGNNPLVSVPRELDEFEKAYTGLLQNSMKRIDEKDFSTASNLLYIDDSDPAKWNEFETTRYINYESERWEECRSIA